MDKRRDESAAPLQPSPSARVSFNWKLWLGISLFIAFIIGVNIEKYSPEGQARSAAAFRGAAQQIGHDACDEYEWSQTPGKCKQLAAEARQRAEKRFQSYQK